MSKFDTRNDHRRVRRFIRRMISDYRQKTDTLGGDIARELVRVTRSPVCHRKATGAQP